MDGEERSAVISGVPSLKWFSLWAFLPAVPGIVRGTHSAPRSFPSLSHPEQPPQAGFFLYFSACSALRKKMSCLSVCAFRSCCWDTPGCCSPCGIAVCINSVVVWKGYSQSFWWPLLSLRGDLSCLLIWKQRKTGFSLVVLDPLRSQFCTSNLWITWNLISCPQMTGFVGINSLMFTNLCIGKLSNYEM